MKGLVHQILEFRLYPTGNEGPEIFWVEEPMKYFSNTNQSSLLRRCNRQSDGWEGLGMRVVGKEWVRFEERTGSSNMSSIIPEPSSLHNSSHTLFKCSTSVFVSLVRCEVSSWSSVSFILLWLYQLLVLVMLPQYEYQVLALDKHSCLHFL